MAAVHGPALAGACELAMACDITIASEGAIFGEPELRFGAGIVVMLLPWLVGVKRAKEIILLGLDRIDAREAAQVGLVNRVVPVGTHLKAALSVAQQLARVDRPLMAETKRAINRAYAIMGLDEALEEGLEIDIGIEGQGMPKKPDFWRSHAKRGFVPHSIGGTENADPWGRSVPNSECHIASSFIAANLVAKSFSNMCLLYRVMCCRSQFMF